MPRINEGPDKLDFIRRKVNFNTITACFLIVFSAVLLIIIPDQIAKPKLLMGRALMGLKPTLFPYIAGSLLLLLSIWYLVKSFSLDETNLFRQLDRNGALKVSVSIAVFLAYALLMVPLGFVVSTFLAMLVLTTFFGNRNFVIGISISVAVPLIVFFGFTRLLSVSLPEFPFF